MKKKPAKKNTAQLESIIRRNTARGTVSLPEGLTVAETLGAIARRERTPWALAGGIAMQLYGFIRATEDVDIIASRALRSVESTRQLSFGGETYLVELADGRTVEADWIVRNDDLEELYAMALQDAIVINGISVLTPEWLVIIKKLAGRAKDEMDLLWLLRAAELVDRDQIIALLQRLYGRGSHWPIRDMQAFFLQADFMSERDSRGK